MRWWLLCTSAVADGVVGSAIRISRNGQIANRPAAQTDPGLGTRTAGALVITSMSMDVGGKKSSTRLTSIALPPKLLAIPLCRMRPVQCRSEPRLTVRGFSVSGAASPGHPPPTRTAA